MASHEEFACGRVSLLAAVLMAACASSTRANDLVGQASVIDGDTLEIHGIRLRLFGIDAPEGGQLCADAQGKAYRCGQQSATALAGYVQGKMVTCIGKATGQYGRIVAICSVASTDIGDWLVRRGLAVDYTYFSKGKYRDAEAADVRPVRVHGLEVL